MGAKAQLARVFYQDAEKVRQPVLFIWFIWFVSFFGLNQKDQKDQTDQITRQTGLVPDVLAIEVLLRPNGFPASC